MNKQVILVKGKNYSGNSRKRNLHDNYVTPYSMTTQLLETLKRTDIYINPNDNIIDPATGQHKAIEYIFNKNDYKIQGTDIIDGNDFLESTIKYDWIITNPPFKLFNEFVLHAWEYTKKGMIILGKIDFLTGQSRYKSIYSQGKNPDYVFIFTRKPMLTDIPRSDGKYATGIDGYAWYIWNLKESQMNQYPVILWIDNQKYILNKIDKK